MLNRLTLNGCNCNLLTDAKWQYTWDAENRLIAMETRAGLPAAMPPVRLEFVYDYMSRRCVKRLYDPSAQSSSAPALGGNAIIEGSSSAVVQAGDAAVANDSRRTRRADSLIAALFQAHLLVPLPRSRAYAAYLCGF